MSAKLALIIANTEYTDANLAKLTAPGKDAEALAYVLREKDICAFDEVKVLLNESESVVSEGIEEFFEEKKSDDLLLLYFSGHGIRDERGSLYLAVKNTNYRRLRSTAIKADFIRDAMETSRSKRMVLILDCCNSGAFADGTKAATGASIGTASAFEVGYGRVILTASDAIQFAWEGNRVIGDKTQNSLFTHFLVGGLKGEADLDGDGRITVDELYDYAYEKVRLATPKQTPSKFSTKQQGTLILRENITIQDTRPVPLPDDLKDAINSSWPKIREAAVHELKALLNERNLRLAHSARLALEKIAKEDDSRYISELAAEALKSIGQVLEKSEEGQGENSSDQSSDHQGGKASRPSSLQAPRANAPITSAQVDSSIDIKTLVQNELLSRLDPSMDITSTDEVRRTIQDLFEQILAEKYIVLSRPERARLFELIVAEVLKPEIPRKDETPPKKITRSDDVKLAGTPASKKIRVMIVDDNSQTRESVRKLLQFEPDVEVVGVARTGREAIMLSQELNPDVVLMEIDMPDMDGISATEAIRAKQPAVQVVMLSVQSDQKIMRRAMLAGVRDFLTKPPLGDELISAIRRLARI